MNIDTSTMDVSNTTFNEKKTKKIKPSAVIICLFTTAVCLYIFTLKWFYTSQSTLQKVAASTTGELLSSQKYDVYQKRIQQLEEQLKTFDQMRDRILFLETKLNSYLSFGIDPFIGFKNAIECKNVSTLIEYCTEEGKEEFANEEGDCYVDQAICLDDYPFTTNGDDDEPCIVYDFGIRKEPEFGRILSKEPFNCKVFAFDPSPITKKWYAETPDLIDNPNYQLFDYGAGGDDEEIILREYNWNQITILQYPNLVVNANDCTDDDERHCKYIRFEEQKRHRLPVRSLSSIMNELGHDKISILKLDIEGSEFRFLESMINSGVCRHVDQLTLEWHHYDYDSRYGISSSPQINMFVELLAKKCGLKQFWVLDPSGGWPSHDKVYVDMGITLRYNLAAFRRDKSWSMDDINERRE